MSYIINKTDGTILTEVVDGSIDQTSSDITLIGKNSSSYGEFLNENLVHMLENFANTNQPNFPIQGQLWFDTGEKRLKIYDGTSFKVSGGTIVATTAPSTLAPGDIWIDSTRQQLYFNDGVSTMLAGPQYTAQQGISGFETTDILDTNNINRTVVYMFVSQVLIGIWSKDAFTPANPISGFTGDILVGFNTSNYPGIKQYMTANKADALVDPVDGSSRTASSFVSTVGDSATSGTLSIQNEVPLYLGASGQSIVTVTSNDFKINSNVSGQNFEINVLNSNGLQPAIHVDAAGENIGLYNELPEAMLHVGTVAKPGDVIIEGTLTVKGTLTTINTANLVIEDKLIELGKTDTPSNSTADGGGITLSAGADVNKSITFDLSKTSWVSSEHFGVASGKSFKVGSFDVLNQTTLGSTVASSSLTSVGILTTLQVSNLAFSGTTISSVPTNGSVTLLPNGSGSVNVSAFKITNLATPATDFDAANKVYVDSQVQTAPLAITLNTTSYAGGQESLLASNYLSIIYPAGEHQQDTLCRVVCLGGAMDGKVKLFSLISGTWSYQNDLN